MPWRVAALPATLPAPGSASAACRTAAASPSVSASAPPAPSPTTTTRPACTCSRSSSTTTAERRPPYFTLSRDRAQPLQRRRRQSITAPASARAPTPVRTGPAGYTASAWNCVGGVQNGSSITVGLGVSATCTITNTDNPPSLTLDKVVVNDNGGTAIASDFTLTATGPTRFRGAGATSITAALRAQGTYALSEIRPGRLLGQRLDLRRRRAERQQRHRRSRRQRHLHHHQHRQPAQPDPAQGRRQRQRRHGDAANFTLTATGPTGFHGAGPTVDNGTPFVQGAYRSQRVRPCRLLGDGLELRRRRAERQQRHRRSRRQRHLHHHQQRQPAQPDAASRSSSTTMAARRLPPTSPSPPPVPAASTAPAPRR